MASEKPKILIVGDELGLSEVLIRAFEKEGHQVFHAVRADEASTLLSQQKIGILLVDCMLQGGMNGVDFVLHVKKNFTHVKALMFLMSGIFIDKDFIKDAMTRTKAVAFIEKKNPFDSAAVVKLVKTNLSEGSSDAPPARKILYQMFSKEKVSTREKRKILESLEDVGGFDLPFIYSLLVETKSSGYLNIYEKNGAVSGISISQGCIVGVDAEDKTTYLGEMLIQSGYAMAEHVQAALAERSSQKMGQRLIRANLLSPHAFDLVLTEQMNLRLSRTIVDHPLKVNFAATDVEMSTPCIDAEQLQFFLHDWIASKISPAWLRSLYMMWAGHHLQLSPTFKGDHAALGMSLVQSLPGLMKLISENATLNQLLENKKYNEAAVYKAIHFLLTKGLIVFGARAAFRNDAEQQAALRKIWNDIQSKNPFEIVDLIGAENLDPEGIATLLGPQPKDAAGSTGTLWQNLKTKLEETHRKTSDAQSREQYNRSNQSKEIENKIKVSRLLEDAKQALGLNQFAKAAPLLAEVQKLNADAEQFHLMSAWCRIGLVDLVKTPQGLKEIEFELMQIPAEERYDALYPFVVGMFHKAKGDFLGAKKNFEKALGLNNAFIAARRELGMVSSQIERDKGGMTLSSMVAGLFKKK